MLIEMQKGKSEVFGFVLRFDQGYSILFLLTPILIRLRNLSAFAELLSSLARDSPPYPQLMRMLSPLIPGLAESSLILFLLPRKRSYSVGVPEF